VGLLRPTSGRVLVLLLLLIGTGFLSVGQERGAPSDEWKSISTPTPIRHPCCLWQERGASPPDELQKSSLWMKWKLRISLATRSADG